MSTKPNVLDPLQNMAREQKVEKQLERLKTKEERIQAVLAGEQPTDTLSWEFYIWKTYNNPLRIK